MYTKKNNKKNKKKNNLVMTATSLYTIILHICDLRNQTSFLIISKIYFVGKIKNSAE